MEEVVLIKRDSLPDSLVPNALYFIQPVGSDSFRFFVTTSNGVAVENKNVIVTGSDYGLIGLLDGVNRVFKTKAIEGFKTGSARLYVNGVRQFKPDDFIEVDNFFIELTVPPEADDNLILDYIINE